MSEKVAITVALTGGVTRKGEGRALSMPSNRWMWRGVLVSLATLVSLRPL